MTDLPTHGRYDYSAIRHRPVYDWPNGKRLAVYVAINLEHFAFGEGLGAELAPGGPQPDVLNYAWRDWGNRVGVWRLIDLFDSLSLPVSVLVNSSIYAHCPTVMDAFRARGDEVVAHGRTNSERQGVLDRAVGSSTDRRDDTGDRGGRRAAAARLAGALDQREPCHARPAGRSRLHLPVGLVHGRPAGVDARRAADASSRCHIRRN